MKHFVLMTAKGGNTTLKDKNLILINGLPSMQWGIDASKKCPLIDSVFLSTEDSKIASLGSSLECKILHRPEELAQKDSNHGDVIIHCVKKMISDFGVQNQDTVTILLGNTVMVTEFDIERCIEALKSNPKADSVMTVWKAQDDHPYRAMGKSDEGYLKSFNTNLAPDTNRQSYPDVYFYDQGPWTVRVSTLLRCEITREGPGAWWWMGKRSMPLERLWVTGRDTHSQFDVDISEWWLQNYPLKGKKNPFTLGD